MTEEEKERIRKRKREWLEGVKADPERYERYKRINAAAQCLRYHLRYKDDPEYKAKRAEKDKLIYQRTRSDPGRYAAYLERHKLWQRGYRERRKTNQTKMLLDLLMGRKKHAAHNRKQSDGRKNRGDKTGVLEE